MSGTKVYTPEEKVEQARQDFARWSDRAGKLSLDHQHAQRELDRARQRLAQAEEDLGSEQERRRSGWTPKAQKATREQIGKLFGRS